MGLKPSELYSTTVYDFNMMAEAFSLNKEHELKVMRTHAYLVSVHSGLDKKGRNALSPEKMYPLEKSKPSNKIMSKEEVKQRLLRAEQIWQQ